jgi:hypothetical protein
MNNNHTIQNQKGSALFEIVVAMAILVLVLTSMIITLTYARYKCIMNYHDRVAILKADAELQKIRYLYDTTNRFGSLSPVSFQIKDSKNAKPINCIITFSPETHSDNSVGLGVVYTTITATVKWEEHRSIIKPKIFSGKKRVKILREDYYSDGSGA